MKEHKNAYKLILTLIISLIFIAGCFSVSAETVAEETYAIESFVPDTTEEYYEEYTEEITQDPTESDSLTEETSESSEVSESDTTSATETKPEPTYREPLPEASEEDIVIPEAIGSIKEENEPALFWGFVAWICIGVGISVVLAVLLTTKTKAYRGGGKKRYSTGDKISGKKRLLNDTYYQGGKRK